MRQEERNSARGVAVETDQQRWSSRSIGNRLQHGSFYLLIRIGGKPLAYLLLYLVVAWYVVLHRSVRARCRHYLRRRFPGRDGFLLQTVDCYRLVLNFGRVLIDRAALGLIGPKSLEADFENPEELVKLVEGDQGIILLSSHVGCWQTAFSALGHLPAKVSIVLRRDPGDLDLQYYEHRGLEPPFSIIDPDREFLGGVLSMMNVLEEGGILGLMGDRVFGGDSHVATTEFLGEPAEFPISPYVLASATGSPIVVLYSQKTGRNRYALQLTEVIRVPPGLGRNRRALLPYLQEFVTSLERYLLEHPWQYFNFHDLWALHDVASNPEAELERRAGDSGVDFERDSDELE